MDEKRVFTPEEKQMIGRVARAIQFGHSQKTTGEGRKWETLSADEHKLWLQLTRRALAKFDKLREAGPDDEK